MKIISRGKGTKWQKVSSGNKLAGLSSSANNYTNNYTITGICLRNYYAVYRFCCCHKSNANTLHITISRLKSKSKAIRLFLYIFSKPKNGFLSGVCGFANPSSLVQHMTTQWLCIVNILQSKRLNLQ